MDYDLSINTRRVRAYSARSFPFNETARTIHENESIYIPIGSVHRRAKQGRIPLELIETQTGNYLGANLDMGFIKLGQNAVIKLEAFPFTRTEPRKCPQIVEMKNVARDKKGDLPGPQRSCLLVQ